MTDWSEISLSGNKYCSCRHHSGNLIEATEATPLITSNSSIQVEVFLNNFDKIWVACLAFIMIAGTTIGIYLLCLERQGGFPDELDIVSRKLWNAEPPRSNLTDLSLPVEKILIHQTNTSECVNNDECASQVKNIQKMHIEVLNEPDIVYNFVIAGDGRIYEGRGWEKSSMKTRDDALAIAFLGNFSNHRPSEIYTDTLLTFLDYAIIQEKVLPCYQVLMEHLSRRYFIDLISVITAHRNEQHQCDDSR